MSIKLKKSFKTKIENDPSRDSIIMTIEDICKRVEENKIIMPIFQTGLRWTEDKIRDFLNFQLTGFAAISPISMCQLDFGFDHNEGIHAKYGSHISVMSREKLESIRGEVLSLTDGQQRVTNNYKCYIGHKDLENFVIDLKAGKVVIIGERDIPKEWQIPVGVIYNKSFSVFDNYINKHPELQESSLRSYLSLIRTKFLGYRYTVNQAKNLDEKQQMEWFEILNNAGSKIPLKEMKLSRLKIKDVDYHSEYINKFISLLNDKNYLDIFSTKATQVSYPLAALNPAYDYLFSNIDAKKVAPIASDVKESRICALNSEQLKQLFEVTINALEKTLEFLEENDDIIKIPKRMEYITFTMGYFIYGDNSELTDERKSFLINWLNNIVFTNKTNPSKREIYYRLINMIPMED